MKKSQPKRQRGFTLIEVILVMAVGIGLIIGGIVFYQKARFSSQIYDTVNMISTVSLSLIEEGRRAGSFTGFDATKAENLNLLLASQYDGTNALDSFGNILGIESVDGGDTLHITLNDMSLAACNGFFGVSSSGSLGVVRTLARNITVNGSEYLSAAGGFDINLCQADSQNMAEFFFSIAR